MYANISGISNVISYQRKFAKSEQISTCGYFNQVRLDKNQRICHFCRVKCAQSCPNYGICLRINITLTNACYYETPSPLPHQEPRTEAHMPTHTHTDQVYHTTQHTAQHHTAHHQELQRRTCMHTGTRIHASGVPDRMQMLYCLIRVAGLRNPVLLYRSHPLSLCYYPMTLQPRKIWQKNLGGNFYPIL
jgi:hypothetical protein